MYAREVRDLSLTTHYTIFAICRTPIRANIETASTLPLEQHKETKCATDSEYDIVSRKT